MNHSFTSQKRSRRRVARLQRRPVPGAVRLQFEPLEDRRVLSGLRADYGNLPLAFEVNQGQAATQVDFLARGSGYMLALTSSTAVLSLQNASGGDVLNLDLVGGNSLAPVAGQSELITKTNYLIGSDPSAWRTDIPNFGQVQYHDVYDGIDLMYYGNQGQLEYDFLVAPGADPGDIKLSVRGAQEIALDAQGNLVLHTSGGDVVQHAPVMYQESGGVRQTVMGAFVLRGDQQIGFQVGDYDRDRLLVIDPILSYSTYLGGSGDDDGNSIAVDGAGNAYITGYTYSTNFPTTPGAVQTPSGGSSSNTDAFVAKLNSSGTALVYSTYLGGTYSDVGSSIAVDSAGQAYLAGWTESGNFPTTASALLPSSNSPFAMGFVTKLDATGSALIYSTYLGSAGTMTDGVYNACGDAAESIAIDASGKAYVTGSTNSTDFITTPGAFQETSDWSCATHAFVAKIDPAQAGTASLVYATFLGGSGLYGGDYGTSIAVDGGGNAYVAGYTDAPDFPTTLGTLQPSRNGANTDAFVTRLNATGTALVYSTYLGGGSDDVARDIALDSAGNAYVTGRTYSADFPVTAGAFQASKPARTGSSGDAFVVKLNADGAALGYGTYLGGSDEDDGVGIAVDAAGTAYVTGITASLNFPTTASAPQSASGGSYDVFVTKLTGSGSALAYSTYLGGSTEDFGGGIALGDDGSAYVTGTTTSSNFPTTAGAFDRTANGVTGGDDAFVAKLTTSLTLSIGDVSIVEGNEGTTSAQFTVTLLDPSSQTVTVDYGTANGTALAGSDYLAVSGTLSFAPGETSQTVAVTIYGDLLPESPETFYLNLSNPLYASIGDGQALATIRDDDSTKFFVVNDATADRTYEYADPGNSLENYVLGSGNTAPRGAASNVAGDRVWVADANKKVYVYNTSGGLLGSWTAGTLPSNAQVEGITTNGTDVWLVDAKSDKVFKYSGAASRLSGSQNASSSFNLSSANSNGKDLVTDGTSLWVVDDGSSVDKVYKYTLSGSSLGSWTIDAADAHPTGITINPANVGDIWIVDNVSLKVHQYIGAASRTSGSQIAGATFALAVGNTNPQGIADPPPPSRVETPSEHQPAASGWMASNAVLGFGPIVVGPANRQAAVEDRSARTAGPTAELRRAEILASVLSEISVSGGAASSKTRLSTASTHELITTAQRKSRERAVDRLFYEDTETWSQS